MWAMKRPKGPTIYYVVPHLWSKSMKPNTIVLYDCHACSWNHDLSYSSKRILAFLGTFEDQQNMHKCHFCHFSLWRKKESHSFWVWGTSRTFIVCSQKMQISRSLASMKSVKLSKEKYSFVETVLINSVQKSK